MKYLSLTLLAVFAYFISTAAVGPINGVTVICSGYTTSLTDTSGSGTWSSTNTAVATVGSTGIVLGMTGGTTTISYTTGGGTVTTTVTINQSPMYPIGSLAVCIGGTTSLSDPVVGGIWSSSDPAVGTVGVWGNVAGISPGTTTISYVLPTGCYNTSVVTVDPVPPAISGSTSVCLGSTVSLTDSVMGGYWSSSAPAIATIGLTTGLVSGISDGIANITYSIATGCVVTITVTVGIGNIITGPGTVCPGSNITLSGSPTGGTWSTGSTTATVGSASGIVNGLANGIAVVTYTTPGCIGSDTIDVGTVLGIVTNNTSTTCTPPDFYVSTCGVSSTYNVTSFYGDGTSDNTPLSTTSVCHADIIHNYAAPGTYTIKQVLYNGTAPMDSTTFTYNYFYCKYLPLKFYYDANANCMMDAGEHYNVMPIRVAVDSNGITIDTVSATSGICYKVYGTAGTVYGFRVIPDTFIASCSADSVIYDTIQTVVDDYAAKYYGLRCRGAIGFDLQVNATLHTGRHVAMGYIIVSNNLCTPENAVVTATYSPDYIYNYAIPAATSYAGNTITWNLSAVSSTTGPQLLEYCVTVPTPWITSTWLTPGDTIHSGYTVSPFTGDIDTMNNNCTILDTVTSSWDPNEMSVSPAGYILSGSQLQYIINFENTGNDTAFNISVYDTLSDNVDIRSLRIVAASAVMNITTLKDGTHNVVKFDFPNINLLDSAHHGQCDGMLIFNINTLGGLPRCTPVYNEAGIYFDYNTVVMTNMVENIIGTSPTAGAITGMDSVCVGQVIVLADTAAGGTWTVSNSTADVYAGEILGATPGTDTVYYTVTNACGTTANTNTAVYVLPASACSTTGINSIPASAAITVFPNPAGNEITITAPEPMTSLTITNLLGQTVFSLMPNSEKTQVDVSGLPSGVYFLKVNNTEVRKFVKE